MRAWTYRHSARRKKKRRVSQSRTEEEEEKRERERERGNMETNENMKRHEGDGNMHDGMKEGNDGVTAADLRRKDTRLEKKLTTGVQPEKGHAGTAAEHPKRVGQGN